MTNADQIPRVVASRVFDTDSGTLTLYVLTHHGDTAAFEYRLVDDLGVERESFTAFGEDTVQALLFCLAAAGDYLQRFVPSASFAGLPSSGLLTTDLENRDGWSARVHASHADVGETLIPAHPRAR